MPHSQSASPIMGWFRRPGLLSRCGRKCKPLICQVKRFGLMAVGVLLTTLLNFRVCSWSVVGKGVLVRARLTGPAQTVYRAELLALVTALQGAEAGALVVSDCKSACRVVS
eukprot:5847918-Amphidinium_carterae.1